MFGEKQYMICIFCKQEHDTTSEEHVIPESIGCPKDAILRKGEVCKKCNNDLGLKVDVHVKDAFDLLAFHYGVPRKGGKPPVVMSRGNVMAEYIDGKPNFYLNNSNREFTTESGKVISRYNKSKKRHIEVDIKYGAKEANVHFSANVGDNIGFVRGIFKIALGTLVLRKGSQCALHPKYDTVRDFINTGTPIMKCICTRDVKQPTENRLLPLWERDGEYIIPIRLFGLDFLCDLGTDQKNYQTIYEMFKSGKGGTNWTYYPCDGI
jgi:hypothetical protein